MISPPVNTRSELIYLLSVAAELEHSLACQYLFSGFSLKQAGDPGLNAEQTRLVRRWSALIDRIAIQEMLHLALVSNLLTAVGGAPNFRRPNFPQLATSYVLGMPSVLRPFGLEAVRSYACWERPETHGFWDDLCADMATPASSAAPLDDSLDADERRYSSIGALYHLIDTAFDTILADQLFIGPKAAQVGQELLPFSPPLIRVFDPLSAHAAIHLIVVEGEGTAAHIQGSHFDLFYIMLNELTTAKASDPNFQPAWPAIENPLYDVHQDSYTPGASRIDDPTTRRVGLLFTACYDLMLQLLMRLFAASESHGHVHIIANAVMSLMTGAVRPLGVLLTRMPAGPNYPGHTAGPSFELYLDTQLLPHSRSALAYARERCAQIADDCEAVGRLPGVSHQLHQVAMLLDFWRSQFAAAERSIA